MRVAGSDPPAGRFFQDVADRAAGQRRVPVRFALAAPGAASRAVRCGGSVARRETRRGRGARHCFQTWRRKRIFRRLTATGGCGENGPKAFRGQPGQLGHQGPPSFRCAMLDLDFAHPGQGRGDASPGRNFLDGGARLGGCAGSQPERGCVDFRMRVVVARWRCGLGEIGPQRARRND